MSIISGRRSFFIGALAALSIVPVTGFADSRQDQKKRFIGQVDQSISIARLSGAPYKFVGKKVELHGRVAGIVDEKHFNLASEDGETVVVIGDARSLEGGQRLRVLGTVVQPLSGTNVSGGAMTFPAVNSAFME